MSSVDDRIVNMQFNNKQFTRGAAESEKALSSLDKTLANTGKGGGIDKLGNSVQATTKKFSIMQITGITAVATIANKAVNAGLKLAKSLTIDPLTDGFNEYNTTLKSVQTIVANTGKSVGTVNRYLDDMNHYSDKTIYNFAEMARNLGTFTAAGVGLKEAKASIQGIANIAALSGSSSQQASTAMYQLSQAIAAGRVGLQDWNSVVNAGMGGKKLQTALATTAQAMGKLNANAVTGGKQLKIMGESFRESISTAGGKQSWLSSDVLTQTLALMDGGLSRASMRLDGITDKGAQDVLIQQKRAELLKQGTEFTDKQWKSMVKMANASFKAATEVKTFGDLMGTVKESVGSLWAGVFRSVLGNFKQSKKMWTAVNGVISGQIGQLGQALTGRAIKDANGVLQQGPGLLTVWRKEGGRKDFFAGIAAGAKAFMSIMGQLKGAFSDVFGGGDAAQGLLDFSAGFRKVMEAITPSEAALKNIRDVFGGVFAVLHIGISVAKGIATAFGAMLGAIFKNSGGASGGILDVAGAIGRFLKTVDKAVTSGGKMTDVFAAIGATAGAVVGPIVKMVGFLAQGIAALATGKGFAGFGKAFDGVKASFADLVSILAGAGAKITAPFEGLSNWFTKIKKQADDFKSSFSGVTGLADKIPGIDIGGGDGGSDKSAVTKAKSLAATTKSVLATTAAFAGLKKTTDDTGNSVSGSLGHITETTDGVTTSIGKMASAFGGEAMSKAEASASNMGAAAMDSKSNWEKFQSVMSGVGNVIKAVGSGIGATIGWIADQFGKLFGDKDALDWASLMNAIFTGGVLLALRSFIKTIQDLASSLPSMAETFNETLVSLRESLNDFVKGMVKAALLRAIAVSIGILVVSLVALSLIKSEDLAKGIGAIASLMTLLVGSLYALGKIDGIEDKAGVIASAFLTISAAVLVMSAAVAIMGKMSLKSLAKGVGGVALLMTLLIGSFAALSKFAATAPAVGGSMIAMSVAILLLTGAVAALGNMDLKTLAKGVGTIYALMALLTGSMLALSSVGKFAPAGASAMIGMAVAITILTAAVATFGNMDMKTLLKGGAAVAALVVLLTGSLLLLASAGPATLAAGVSLIMFSVAIGMLIPVMLSLGLLPWSVILKSLGALALLAIPITLVGAAAIFAAPGFVALGVALLAAGAGMFLFGTGFALLTAAGVAGVGILVVAFEAFLALLPQLAIQMAAAFVAFLETIAQASTRIRKAFQKIFTAILGVIQDSIGPITDLMLELILAGYKVIETTIPRAIQVFTKIIKAGLKAIRSMIPDFVDTGWAVLLGFLDGIDKHLPDVLEKGTKILRKLIKGIANAVVTLANEIGDAVVSIIEGIDAAIENHSREIRDAGLHLMGTIGKGMLEWSPAGVVGSIISGIKKKFSGGGGGGGGGGSSDSGGAPAGRPRVGRVITENPDINAKPKPNKTKKLAPPFFQAGMTLGQALVAGINSATHQGVLNVLANVANLVGQGIPGLTNTINQQYAAQIAAQRAQVEADLLSERASNVKGKKLKGKLNKLANQAQKIADRAQADADLRSAYAARDSSIRDNATDQAALSQDLTSQATDAGDTARDLLAQAQAKEAAAKKIEAVGGKKAKAEAKKLRQQSRDLTDQANAFAALANSLTGQARDAALAATQKSIDEVIKAHDDSIKEEQDAKAFEEADTAGKIDILKKREEEARARAAKAEADYQAAIANAQAARNAGNIAAAEQYLDQAAQLSDQANQARDEAKDALDQMKDLQNGGSDGSGGGPLTPSASILENAASIVDGFTKSMQEAMTAAAATQPTIEFKQYNTSPEALNPSEVYRQTNNLLSGAATRLAPVP